MTRAGRVLRASSIRDLRLLARRRAPRAVFDYTDGGAGDELSLRRSRASYSRVEFVPRVLHDVSSVDVATTILGAPSAAPLVFAPTGFTRMMHTEGESAVARVAARVGIPYALSPPWAPRRSSSSRRTMTTKGNQDARAARWSLTASGGQRLRG